jgi:trimethylguanosine synthase
LRLARHNALQLGVADRIEFILGDFVSYAKSLLDRGIGEEIDVVFLSPPWGRSLALQSSTECYTDDIGGTEYLTFADPSAPTSSSYPLSAILPIHGKELFELCTSLTPNIAYYLPRNVNIDELSALARPLPEEGGGGREWVEVEEEWVGDKLKAVTAYYGALIAE